MSQTRLEDGRSRPLTVASGFWSVLDQGLFSAANFAANVCLARFAPDTYGEFATSFSVLVLADLVHRAVLVQPTLVHWPTSYAQYGVNYPRALIRLHFSVCAGFCALILAVALAFMANGERSLALSLLGLALALPFVLLTSLLRRISYAIGSTHIAAAVGVVHLACLMGALFVISNLHLLSAFTGFVSLAAASMAVCWLLVRASRLDISWNTPPSVTKWVRGAHLAFARWEIPASFMSWAFMNVYYVVLPLIRADGFHESGVLRVGATMIMPTLQANGAIGNLLLARMASAAANGHSTPIIRVLALLSTVAAAYWAVLALWGDPLLHLLFETRWTDATSILVILGAVPLLGAFGQVLRAATLAANRPDLALVGNGVAAVFSLSLGIHWTFVWGVAGCALTMAVSMLLQVVTLYCYALPRIRGLHAVKGTGQECS